MQAIKDYIVYFIFFSLVFVVGPCACIKGLNYLGKKQQQEVKERWEQRKASTPITPAPVHRTYYEDESGNVQHIDHDQPAHSYAE